MEESTTLEDGPTQGKTCYSGRFLDSHSFARNDTSGGGSIRPHRLYSERGMAMNHRRYIAWYHSTTQVVFEAWRAANCRPYLRNTIQPHGLYWGRPPGTAHRPFPTVSLMCALVQPTLFKNVRFLHRISNRCQPSKPQNCQLSTVNCQLSK